MAQPDVAANQIAARSRWYRLLNYPAIGVGLAIAASLFLLAVAQINFGSAQVRDSRRPVRCHRSLWRRPC